MPYFRPEIKAIDGYTPGEQPAGDDVVKLNTNENPYRMSEMVERAIVDAAARGLEKYPQATADTFRQRAAEVFDIPGPDWVLCGNGSDDILTIVTRTLVGQDQRLRLPYPSYILYKTLAQLQGARSEEIHFRPDWTLGEDFAQGDDSLRLVFLPNPNSPSGTVVSRESILELADRLPCPLLVDEAYADFAEFNCLDLVQENEKIMVSRTLSKSYALAGLRFGYLVAQPHMIEQFMKVKDSYNCDALSIAGATAAINDQAWLAENRQKILAGRDRLTRALRSLGFDVVDSQANFVWATHPSLSLQPIFKRLKQDRVFVRYMVYTEWGEGLRISVGTDAQLDRCLDRLRAAM
ncbi:MAG: histidinol-phosphate transaminase [Planctomycetia bacterium]|jgi:histidinol-phosphate aminotransferase